MKAKNGRNLRGDALTERAVKLGIEIEEFRNADGSINELDLRRRISMVARYSSEFHFGKLLVVCIAAFGICAISTWLAVHFLWHPL